LGRNILGWLTSTALVMAAPAAVRAEGWDDLLQSAGLPAATQSSMPVPAPEMAIVPENPSLPETTALTQEPDAQQPQSPPPAEQSAALEQTGESPVSAPQSAEVTDNASPAATKVSVAQAATPQWIMTPPQPAAITPVAPPVEQNPTAAATAIAPLAEDKSAIEVARPTYTPVLVDDGEVDSGWRDGVYLSGLQSDNSVMSLSIQGKPEVIANPVMIDEAVALAMRNNDQVQGTANNREAAYWEKLANYAMYGPTVSFDYARGRETSSPASYNSSTGVRVAEDRHTRRDRTFAIRQPLVDLTIVENILMNRHRQTLAEHQERDVRETIAYSTVDVYLRLIQSAMAIRLADDYRDYLEKLGGRMDARLQAGGATPGDLERVRGRLTNAASARIAAEGQYNADLADFYRLTHVTPSEIVIPPELSPVVPGLDEAQSKAELNNPAYRGNLEQVDIAQTTRDRSYAALAPKVALEYTDSDIYNAGGAARGNPVDGVYPNQEDQRLLVVARWSLTSGYDILNAQAGGSRLREARYNAEDSRRRLSQAVESSYTAIEAANRQLHVLQQGVAANEKVVAEFEDQYVNGKRTMFELLDAYEQLYASRLNLMRLVVARAQSSYLVHRQMGTLEEVMRAASQATGKVDEG
jgi:outer membrane protein TolC